MPGRHTASRSQRPRERPPTTTGARHRAESTAPGLRALRHGTRLTAFAATAALTLALLGSAPLAEAAKKKKKKADPVPVTTFQVPFPCADTWTASTRAGHSPSAKSVDFNRTGDLGAPTVAAAAGTVTVAQATPKGGYGRYVVIDHGNSESTVYAHLDKVVVSKGQRVDAATQIGNVGKSGRVTGAHLHFEEKKGKAVISPWLNGSVFRYGKVASANCVDVPLSGTTNSAVARPVIYRRAKASSFVIRTGATATRTEVLGTATDEPVVGDWNGDRTTDVGVRKAGTNLFQLKTGPSVRTVAFGLPTDVPLAGDWDGDGIWQIGVYRASTSTFLLLLDTGATLSIPLGAAGATPITGDFDGDGATDVGIHQSATRTFTLRTVLNDRVTVTRHVLGAVGDLPVTGDWDGNGVTELGTWTPRTARFTSYQGTFVPIAPQAAARKVPIARAATTTFGRKRR